MTEVTQILVAIEQGDQQASEELLPLVYAELRRIAAARMVQESPGHTLQATALVHEAFLRLIGPDNKVGWDNRAHFLSAAAESMRRILIDHARHKKSIKAGGNHHRVDVSQIELAIGGLNLDIFALDEALERLAEISPRKAELVKLRFFTGMGHNEAAAVLGISRSTADNEWAYAKSWLRVELE
ncbi:MAG: RNA polymerase subunit sigma [Blastopirellula sp.]|nr:MAG: RNA polymerase subunit sigma [Blastopirellula sp.]